MLCAAVLLLLIWGTAGSFNQAIPYFFQIPGLAAAAVLIWYLLRAWAPADTALWTAATFPVLCMAVWAKLDGGSFWMVWTVMWLAPQLLLNAAILAALLQQPARVWRRLSWVMSRPPSTNQRWPSKR